MKSLISITILLWVVIDLSGSLVVHSGQRNYAFNSRTWKLRLQAAVRLIRQYPCMNWRSGNSCAGTRQIPVKNMNIYIAKKHQVNEHLTTSLPDRKHRSLLPNSRNIHSVLAVDPYPEASFGHLVYIFFVEENANRLNCTQNSTAILTASGDCIIAATKTHCKNSVNERKRKKCYIDFLPHVFVTDDSKKTQRLVCQDRLFGFGKCRTLTATPPLQCANSPRCPFLPTAPPKTCTFKRCDYAVLVSGGWNHLTAHPRHAKNLQLFWKFLLHNKFKKEHITTFYSSDGKIELDGNPKTTRDASAAVTDFGVTDYIGKLCKARWCVDTLVLYLTGPAKSNGALLMWDANGDGLTENKEMFAVHEIFKHLKDCTAKRVYIIADYSYSGHLVHKLNELSRSSHGRFYQHITVVASSQANEYSWRNDFTQTLIKYGKQSRTRCIKQLFQDVKSDFQSRRHVSMPSFGEGSLSSGNLTIYGGRCGLPWSQASGDMGCKVIPITEFSNRPKHKRSS